MRILILLFHFDADPDPAFHSDPYASFQFDADTDTDPTTHFFPVSRAPK